MLKSLREEEGVSLSSLDAAGIDAAVEEVEVEALYGAPA